MTTSTTLGADGAVEVRDAGRSFGDREILREVDLTIAPGEFVALLGASGSGKSTLLRAIGGLDDGFTGTISAPASKAIAFQEHRLVPWQPVWRNVALGLRGRDAKSRALEALTEVGLRDKADVWPSTLSGGESQRVALARALVREPRLLLLDEPFGALDALTRGTAQRLVERLWQHHRPATLLVTHDVEEAVLLADRALVLRDHHVAEEVVIDLPRPRSVVDPEFVALRYRLLSALGVQTPAPATTASAQPDAEETT
ncbi:MULTISPECIES: ABC transporter ATP-binding protein [unclassified Gordonia (in: high G+C Gram-positive bacteria)]|uniref:ABC transporter ATP-binding protein n=1 Tax=unclassified Gordonia (in: high G+C Gram-positive bacteria) TaxID=2657482 RepID=UPI001F0D46EA|nr:ABC transporter ATP-binding protein [Gordonia sp. ABSL49_1]MCH5644805.1 ABC transporter ATP-binding protein [Gordonia sp. ABSL49_1]